LLDAIPGKRPINIENRSRRGAKMLVISCVTNAYGGHSRGRYNPGTIFGVRRKDHTLHVHYMCFKRGWKKV
jgi:hypothetical protein